MSADWAAYESARLLLARFGPWLLWPAVLLSWAAVFLCLRPSWGARWSRTTALAVNGLLGAAFLALVWFHRVIYRSLPLELPPSLGDWVNRQLAAMARQGAGSLPAIDWALPPRFGIPLWIEGEKLFFWTLILALVVLVEARRRHVGYRLVLWLLLALQLTGTAVWSNPFSPPLPRFHQEVMPWFTADPMGRVRLLFSLYPRMKFYYNASYMWLHPPMLFIAYATLAVTFAASLFTFRDARPELEASAYDYAKIGYLLLTVGMLVGYPWAIVAWGPNWWWDPKIASSIMMWLLYSAYLHHRLLIHQRGIRGQTAFLGVLCYASLLFTYFMSWFFPGEHTF